MTDASISGLPLVGRVPRSRTRDVPLPRPQFFGAPVFLSDCASPLAGETVLSLLMKRMGRDTDNRPQQSVPFRDTRP